MKLYRVSWQEDRGTGPRDRQEYFGSRAEAQAACDYLETDGTAMVEVKEVKLPVKAGSMAEWLNDLIEDVEMRLGGSEGQTGGKDDQLRSEGQA